MSDAGVAAGTDKDSATEKPAKRGGLGKLVVIGVLVLAVAGAGGYVYVSGMLDSLLGKSDEHAAEQAAPAHDPSFIDLPGILVNLKSQGGNGGFLKVEISLELSSPADKAEVEKRMARVVDGFQTYLREVSAEELQGAASVYRLREDLLARASQAVKPVVVRDVLFRQMLVQ